MKNHCIRLLLGISYGILNIFTYTQNRNNLLGTFLSSIPMWLVIPYFVAVKSDNHKKAVLNSTLSLMGIFAGYHITRILKSGVQGIDIYDMLWIIIGAVFGLIWGFIVCPVNNKNINLLQKNFLPAAFIAEALHEMHRRWVFRFPQNFSVLHGLLLAAGVALFIVINRKNLKCLKNYVVFIALSVVEFLGITAVYNLLYIVL